MTFQRTTPDALVTDVQRQPRLFLLLDGGLAPGLEVMLNTLDHRIWHAWIYSETEYAAHHRDGPLLVQARADTPLLQAFMQAWPSRHLGGLLMSDQSFDVVLVHLRCLRHARLPDGTQSLLRIHDPRASRGVIQGLDGDAIDALLGPVDRWYWCEWNEGKGDWYRACHSSPGHGHAANAPLALTAERLQALHSQQIAFRDTRFARRLLAGNIPALERVDEHTMLTYVRRHSLDAATRGFENDEDMYGFLEVYFRYHEQLFADHSPLARIMSQSTVPAWRRVQQAHAFMKGAA